MTGALCMLAGAVGPPPVTLANGNVSSSGTTSQTATYQIRPDHGIYHSTTSGGAVRQYDWLEAWANPAYFESRATLQLGALAAGTVGAWEALDAVRSWAVTDPSADGEPTEAVLTIEIRNIFSQLVLKSAIVTLTASRG